MSRIFISLYLFVVIALFAIGWGSEAIWHSLNDKSDSDARRLAQLAQISLLAIKDEQTLQSFRSELQKQLQFNVEILEQADFAAQGMQPTWLTSQSTELSYSSDDSLIILQPIPEMGKVLQIGPIQQAHENHSLKSILQSISYLMLAVFIAAWTWPLWRDLRKLNRANENFAKGNFNQQISLHKGSAIYPLADSFNHMANKIAQLIDEQKLMLNAVSHDLRTPLSRLKFSLAMMQGNPEKDKADDNSCLQIDSMKQDVQALETLIDELLSYARLEHQNNKLSLQKVPVVQIVRHFLHLFESSNVNFKTDLADDYEWCCDGFLFERVVQNLFSNAEKYAVAQVNVELSVATSNCERLVFVVEDDGKGVCQQEQPHIFKPFYRADEKGKSKSNGFGLGLAIVDKICRWHKGQVTVSQSKLGGAQFSACFGQLHWGKPDLF
ncbi:ATP-binding protein [Catenovulum sediminis]|uniref:histidine kinase n=1 Tax=Catenovulum sediminis TaxID=1740262 RepID=A0ABV1RET8_9ALTE